MNNYNIYISKKTKTTNQKQQTRMLPNRFLSKPKINTSMRHFFFFCETKNKVITAHA